MKSKRISKDAHVERMGDRAARREQDHLHLSRGRGLDAYTLERLRAARARNGVGRPPRRA